MSLLILGMGQQFLNFDRAAIIVVIGLVSIIFDSRLMKRKGLERESFWAKVMGGSVAAAAAAAWIILQLLD